MTQPHGEYRGEFPPGYAVQPYRPYQQPPAPVPYIPGPAFAAPVPMPAARSRMPVPADRYPLVSAGGRLGARLLDGVLVLVTLGIGWLVWSCLTWSDGQTPAKSLLGHVVADENTGEAFGWGRMAMRCLVIDGLLGWLFNGLTCGIYFWVDALMVLGDRQRTLHDRMAGSVVRHR